MSTARILSTESQPDNRNKLAAKLDSIEKHTLGIDTAFIQLHAKSFVGPDYVKYQELNGFIADAAALRNKISLLPDRYSEHHLKIEIEGFNISLRNKIKDYKEECDNRIEEISQTLKDRHFRLLQRLKELRKHRREDVSACADLATPYDDLIGAIESDAENMQAEREFFVNTVYENKPEYYKNINEILARSFYINHFEKSFLLKHLREYSQLENNLLDSYKKALKKLLAELKGALTKQIVIHHNFTPSFEKKDDIRLTAMIKVLQEVLQSSLQGTPDSLASWREKFQLLHMLQKDNQTYLFEFYKAERRRRKSSSCYQSAMAKLALIETEMACNGNNNDRMTILTAIKNSLESQILFLINGRSYKGITVDHTPSELDAIFEKSISDQTLVSLTTCLRENHFSDVNLINWSSNFMQKFETTKSSRQRSKFTVPLSALDEEPYTFTLQQKMKEKTLDTLVERLTQALCPKSVGPYSIWSIFGMRRQNTQLTSVLIQLQQLISDKSENNLQKIIQLTSQFNLPALQEIAATAKEIMSMRPQPVIQNNTGLTLLSST